MMLTKNLCIFDFKGNILLDEEFTYAQKSKAYGSNKRTTIQLIGEKYNLSDFGECFLNLFYTDGEPFISLILKNGIPHSEFAPARVFYAHGRPHFIEWFQNGILKSPSPEIPTQQSFNKHRSSKNRFLYKDGNLNLTSEINQYIKNKKIDDFDENQFYTFVIENPELFK